MGMSTIWTLDPPSWRAKYGMQWKNHGRTGSSGWLSETSSSEHQSSAWSRNYFVWKWQSCLTLMEYGNSFSRCLKFSRDCGNRKICQVLQEPQELFIFLNDKLRFKHVYVCIQQGFSEFSPERKAWSTRFSSLSLISFYLLNAASVSNCAIEMKLRRLSDRIIYQFNKILHFSEISRCLTKRKLLHRENISEIHMSRSARRRQWWRRTPRKHLEQCWTRISRKWKAFLSLYLSLLSFLLTQSE